MEKKILIIVSLILCVAFNMSAQNKVCSIKDSVCSVKEKLELLIIPQDSGEKKSDVSVPADVTTSKPNHKSSEKVKVLSQEKATVSDSKSEGNNKKPSKESKEKPQKDTKTAKNKSNGKKVKEKGVQKQESKQEEPYLGLENGERIEHSKIADTINVDCKAPITETNDNVKKETKNTAPTFSKKAKLSNIDIQKNIVSARGTLQGVIDAIDTLQQELDKYKIYQFLATESDSIFHAGYIQFADNQIPYYAKAFYDYITDVHNMYELFNSGIVRDMTLGDIETIKHIENKSQKKITLLCLDFQYSPFFDNLTEGQQEFLRKLLEYAKEYNNIENESLSK